jgi:hypothetical protein
MAVHFTTATAQALLAEFNKRIAQSEPAGKITTWERSADGVYYTHKAAEWRGKAWMKPAVQNDQLVFNIIKSQNSTVSAVVYAYYHGHFDLAPEKRTPC